MSKGSNPPFGLAGAMVVTAGTASVNTAMGGNGEAVMVTNGATSNAYVGFSTDPAATVAAPGATFGPSGALVLPGTQRLMFCGAYSARATVILASGSGSVTFERGDGSAY